MDPFRALVEAQWELERSGRPIPRDLIDAAYDRFVTLAKKALTLKKQELERLHFAPGELLGVVFADTVLEPRKLEKLARYVKGHAPTDEHLNNLVLRNVRNWLHELRSDLDPVGTAIYRNLRAATERDKVSALHEVVHLRRGFSQHSVLVFRQTGPASDLPLDEVVHGLPVASAVREWPGATPPRAMDKDAADHGPGLAAPDTESARSDEQDPGKHAKIERWYDGVLAALRDAGIERCSISELVRAIRRLLARPDWNISQEGNRDSQSIGELPDRSEPHDRLEFARAPAFWECIQARIEAGSGQRAKKAKMRLLADSYREAFESASVPDPAEFAAALGLEKSRVHELRQELHGFMLRCRQSVEEPRTRQ